MPTEAFRIFINYRRSDSGGYAGRIYDALCSHSPSWQVFMDIDNIEPGVDFTEVIDHALDTCHAVIAVIGLHWLQQTDSRGRRRLEHPGDFVRLELSAALDRSNVRVIPILVQGANMPSADDLPDVLGRLARRNAVELSDSRWAYDLSRLVDVLERIQQEGASNLSSVARRDSFRAGDGEAPSKVSTPIGPREASGASPGLQARARPSLGVRVPVPATELIGREGELASIHELFRTRGVRLVTITGAGGTGKTRLAIEAAHQLGVDFPEGVIFVSLAATADWRLVIPKIAETLEVKEVSGESLETTLATSLRGRRMLFVIDNFEQVLPAGVDLARLLASAPDLKLLVTSRALLHISGEHDYTLSPLPLPASNSVGDPAHLLTYGAVALFAERAQAVLPEFEVDADNAASVAALCIRLDGLPLALELAAARSKLLPPSAILARLDERLDPLQGGPRDLPERQQTLRGTIDWSYELLEQTERSLFERLSVFAGGCDLSAIEMVCALENEPRDLVDEVGSLLDKSLLRRRGGRDDGPRFFMLRTIRDYAMVRLEASNVSGAVRLRHAEYFIALAEEADEELRGPQQEHWTQRIENDYDNLRAAWMWVRDADEVELRLRLVGALGRFWFARGLFTEGATWTREALEQAPPLVTAPRGKALWVACCLARVRGDFGEARKAGEEAAQVLRSIGDWRTLAWALSELAGAFAADGDEHRATELLEESIELARNVGDTASLGVSTANLGELAFQRGEHKNAEELFRTAHGLFTDLQHAGGLAFVFHHLALVKLAQSEYEEALEYLREALRSGHARGDVEIMAYCLGVAASVALGQQDAERAALLLGAAESMRRRIGIVLTPEDQRENTAARAASRDALGGRAFEEAWANGVEMTSEQAVACVLGEVADGAHAT